MFPVLQQIMIGMLALYFMLGTEPHFGKSVRKIVPKSACQDNGNAMTNALINQKLVETSANQVNTVLLDNNSKF